VARPAVLFQRLGARVRIAGLICAGGRAAARFSNRNQLKASSPSNVAQTIHVSICLTCAACVHSVQCDCRARVLCAGRMRAGVKNRI